MDGKVLYKTEVVDHGRESLQPDTVAIQQADDFYDDYDFPED